MMFEQYVIAKARPRSSWRRPIIGASLVLHGAAVLGMLVHGFWQLEALPLPKRQISLAVATPLPPPPPPPAGSVKRDQTKTLRKPVKEVSQPVDQHIDEAEPEVFFGAATDEDSEAGADGFGSSVGVRGGVGDGAIPDLLGADRTPMLAEIEPPPAPAPPARVAPTVIEARRVAGEARIAPDSATKLAMQRDGRGQIEAAVVMCVNRAGAVSSTKLVRSSGYDDYDRKLTAAMRAWRYRPYSVDGTAAAVCTTVTFIYRQQ